MLELLLSGYYEVDTKSLVNIHKYDYEDVIVTN